MEPKLLYRLLTPVLDQKLSKNLRFSNNHPLGLWFSVRVILPASHLSGTFDNI